MRCLLHNYPSAFHRVEYVRRGVRRMRLSPYKMSRDAGSIPATSTWGGGARACLLCYSQSVEFPRVI